MTRTGREARESERCQWLGALRDVEHVAITTYLQPHLASAAQFMPSVVMASSMRARVVDRWGHERVGGRRNRTEAQSQRDDADGSACEGSKSGYARNRAARGEGKIGETGSVCVETNGGMRAHKTVWRRTREGGGRKSFMQSYDKHLLTGRWPKYDVQKAAQLFVRPSVRHNLAIAQSRPVSNIL